MAVPTELKTRYFGTATAHDETTEVTYFVDGTSYFRTIRDAIAETVNGDAVYILGWWFDEEFEPYGATAPPTLPSLRRIGDLLADRAYNGVDVRVVVNGGRYLGTTGHAGFRSNWFNMNELQEISPAGTAARPLFNKVAYDWSGARRLGTHHQKATVVLHDSVLTAFVGGMDCNPLHLDAAPHNSNTAPVKGGGGTVPWGWHDAGVRLVGGAAMDVWQNFADRWEEVCTLPTVSLYIGGSGLPKRISYATPMPKPVKTLPASTDAAAPTSDTSVQVLRSRYQTKVEQTENDIPWRTNGGGELLEVRDTLVKAIDAATDYIYIEDQFLGDHPDVGIGLIHGIVWSLVDLLVDPRLGSRSLLPHLEAALVRGVKVILVGSGYADPGDLDPGPKNELLHPELTGLASAMSDNLAVWRIEGTTVHSKLMIIDDCFAAVGSANLHSRSMLGVDSELHTAVVSDGDVVKNLRVDLWREHVGVAASIPAVEAALADPTTAIGMWRTGWRTDGMWHSSNNPSGFSPTSMGPGGARSHVVRAYVGPGTTP